MKRIGFLLCTALGISLFVLKRPVGVAVLGFCVLCFLLSACENMLSRKKLFALVSCERSGLKNVDIPLKLTLTGSTGDYSGRLRLKNMLTGQTITKKLSFTISGGKTAVVDITLNSETCGKISANIMSLKAFDLTGLVWKRVKCELKGSVNIMPDAAEIDESEEAMLKEALESDIYSEENEGTDHSEPIGIREYRQGDSYKSVHWKNKKIYNLGYPRFDLYRDYLEKKEQIHSAPDHKKTVLWLPRWTTDDQFEATTFFDYKDFFVKYFTKNSDVQFICRPHPLMFRNFVSSGDMTEEEVAEFKKHFETKNNFILDSDGDYTKSLEAADVIISDYTSLIIEELLMDVPVIYTGSTKHFGKKAKANAVGLYQLDSRKDMNKVLTGLLKGVDPMKAIRHEVAKSIYPDEPMTVGQKMVEALMEDYKEIK